MTHKEIDEDAMIFMVICIQNKNELTINDLLSHFFIDEGAVIIYINQNDERVIQAKNTIQNQYLQNQPSSI